MKYLKLFESHKVDEVCKRYGIKNYTINSDGSIDVNGDVDLRGLGFWETFKRASGFWFDESHDWTLTEIPIKFRNVNGDFDCRFNKITSLEGSPISCKCFYISNNQITDLKGSPIKVSRFLGGNNLLKSLENGPRICEHDYNVSECQLISLKGIPQRIDGYFGFDSNNIHTLDFLIESSKLNSLKENSHISMGGNPIYNLCKLFIDPRIIKQNSISFLDLDTFLKSLDYGYLRNDIIERYRFDQACNELNITPPESISGYQFV